MTIYDDEKKHGHAGTHPVYYPRPDYLPSDEDPRSSYHLNHHQIERVAASVEYDGQLRDFGGDSLDDPVDGSLTGDIQRLGVAIIDPRILTSPDFCADDKLKALYAIELIACIGKIAEHARKHWDDDREEESFLNKSIRALFVATFDDEAGYVPDYFKNTVDSHLMVEAKRIRDEFCGANYKVDTKKDERIHARGGDMVSELRVLFGDNGLPEAVRLIDAHTDTPPKHTAVPRWAGELALGSPGDNV